MDEKPPRLMTQAQRRFLEAAERIRSDRPTLDDLAYMARELVQVTLPHRNPGDVPEWTRSNGNLTLSIRPGWTSDQKDGRRRPLGYPYGSIPRLLLFWLTAEAVRTRCRTVELGSSLSDFMAQLGLSANTGRGPRGDATRLREQMQRLFRATISFDRKEMTEGGRDGSAWLDMQIAPRGEFWWSPRDPTQTALWGSWIELGGAFFAAITAHPIPLDMRALKTLRRSPLALDLYSWLTYEAFRAHKTGKGRFVAWTLLMRQMGDAYANPDEFARKARAALRKIQALYPALKLGSLRGGIRIEPDTLPAIIPRPTTAVEHVVPPLPMVTDATAGPPPPMVAAVLIQHLQTLQEAARGLRAAEAENAAAGSPPIALKGTIAEKQEALQEMERVCQMGAAIMIPTHGGEAWDEVRAVMSLTQRCRAETLKMMRRVVGVTAVPSPD